MVTKSLNSSFKYLHLVTYFKTSSRKVKSFRHSLGCGTSQKKQLKPSALGLRALQEEYDEHLLSYFFNNTV